MEFNTLLSPYRVLAPRQDSASFRRIYRCIFRALLNFCQNPFVRTEKTTSTKGRYMEQGAEGKHALVTLPKASRRARKAGLLRKTPKDSFR
jgi:hypothetical protein